MKIYFHIDCPEHGTEHSRSLLEAQTGDYEFVATLCPNFLDWYEDIKKTTGIQVLKPTQILAIVEKEVKDGKAVP